MCANGVDSEMSHIGLHEVKKAVESLPSDEFSELTQWLAERRVREMAAIVEKARANSTRLNLTEEEAGALVRDAVAEVRAVNARCGH